MYLPKKDSLRERICRSILNHGPMEMDQIIDTFQGERGDMVKKAVFQLKFHKALEESSEGGYSLTEHVKVHYGVLPAREKPEPEIPVRAWKDWSGKYDPLNGLRREEIRRDIGFKTGSIGFPIGYQS